MRKHFGFRQSPQGSDPSILPLSGMPEGLVRIVKVTTPGALWKLAALGVFINDTVRIVKAGPGPVIFTKENLRVGIGHGIAAHIFVISTDGMRTGA